MITQAIKRWLQNLFAWWPWRAIPETSYMHTPTPYKSATQESSMRTTVEGSIAQPGASSVAVDHSEEDMLTDSSWSMLDERNVPPLTPVAEETSDNPRTPSKEQEKRASSEEETSTPTAAQKLEFLRYLVQNGHINEGFVKGQEPGQYRNK